MSEAVGGPVGLLVNPQAARDVRRLVSGAGSLTNHERARVVRRLLIGLRAAGVECVFYLPERFGLVLGAAEGLEGLTLEPALADPGFEPDDTRRAAAAMVDAGARVLVTHGGDGTNRLVALAAGSTPILPLAAGTNNVFPVQAEATAAGFAAGLLARWEAGESIAAGCVSRHKRIVVEVDGQRDVALVDAAVTRSTQVGSRAVWEPSQVVAFMVTRAAAGSVGLSSLAGALSTIEPTDARGGYGEMGDGTRVVCLLAPGLVVTASLETYEEVPVGSQVELGPLTGTVALDGERAHVLRESRVALTLDADGPCVVDVSRTLRRAQEMGAFLVPGVPAETG